jgi:hypothetical protein
MLHLGHMLERMFEKQNDLKILTHPFSSPRNMQLEWMRSKSFESGMTADTLSKFESDIEKCNENWRTQLAEVETKVDNDKRQVGWNAR